MNKNGNPLYNGSSMIQSHASDPAKCIGTKNANTVFKKGAGGDVDITGWFSVALYPTADGQVAYNGDANKVEPIFAGQQNVLVIHPGVTQFVPNVSCVVCGM